MELSRPTMSSLCVCMYMYMYVLMLRDDFQIEGAAIMELSKPTMCMYVYAYVCIHVA
jgi:hypothetical protein